jgi:serine/threonine protein kinase
LRQGQVQLQKLPNFPGLATPILEFESDGKIHQLLDYYDGWTLAKIIELNQDSSGVYGALLFSWTNQLLDILVPLHRNSPPIVHRDINPSNILVRSDTLELVLLDTSCAIYATPKSSQTPVGTLAYSAPEQLEGRAVPASDIYSLGMTLYAINHCNLPPVASARMYGRRESLELIKIPETVGLDSMFQQSINLDLNTRLKDAVQAKRLLSSPLTEPNGKLGTLKLPSGGRIEQYTLAWYYTGPDGKEVKGSLKDS